MAKTLADFKRRVQIGTKMHGFLHSLNQDNLGEIIMDYGIREVSIVQTNCFALKTEKWYDSNNPTELVDSYCQFPTAKFFEWEDENTAKIYLEKTKGERVLCLTYKFV